MGALFAELANVDTSMGELSLRRRREPTRQVDVYEVKLGDEYLMSSMFTVAEVALARIGLAACRRTARTVVVGGLGLGYTARAALDDDRVEELVVVEALQPVIDWHRQGLLPEAAALVDDDRCRLQLGDFFELARGEVGLDPAVPGRRFDVVLVDIDHTPTHVLDASHADLYDLEGLRRLLRWLAPGGAFALWSDDPPEPGFVATLEQVLDEVRAEVVEFANPLTGGTSANTVYVGLAPTA